MGEMLQTPLGSMPVGYIAEQCAEQRLPTLKPHREGEIDRELSTICMLGYDLNGVARQPRLTRPYSSCQACIMSSAVLGGNYQRERLTQHLELGETEQVLCPSVPRDDKIVRSGADRSRGRAI
ncbi:hypothetical protein ABIC35_001771 [Sphingomonas trueperi]